MSNDLREWIRRFKRWLNRLLKRDSTDRARPGILATRESEHVRLLLLETDYQDAEVVRIRTWRGILRSPSAQFDLLVACDRLKRGGSGSVRLTTTHRFAAFRISRHSIGGKVRTDCLLIADLDCVGFQLNRGIDGYAPQIADSLAVQLIKRSDRDLHLLINFEDARGEEIPGERINVQARWIKILKAYHTEYFPVSGRIY